MSDEAKFAAKAANEFRDVEFNPERFASYMYDEHARARWVLAYAGLAMLRGLGSDMALAKHNGNPVMLPQDIQDAINKLGY